MITNLQRMTFHQPRLHFVFMLAHVTKMIPVKHEHVCIVVFSLLKLTPADCLNVNFESCGQMNYLYRLSHNIITRYHQRKAR